MWCCGCKINKSLCIGNKFRVQIQIELLVWRMLLFQQILGKKTTKPTTADAMAMTKTAPAAMSFIWPIVGSKLGFMWLQSFSMAVFINSAPMTEPKQSTIAIHSALERL